MMIYKFQNKTVAKWFFVGLVFVGLPVAYLLNENGIETSIYKLFAISAAAGVLGELSYYLILKFRSKRMFQRLAKVWEEKERQNQADASKKYPIQNLEKGSKEFDEQFEKRVDYEIALRDASKKDLMKELSLSDKDWQKFLGQSMMGFNRHENMIRSKDY